MHRIKTIAACAIVALGVGATSATAKALITSGDIKDGTIQAADLSASAKRSLRGNVGPRGVQGPQGAPGVGFQGVQGAQGHAGQPGPAGGLDPSKITYVTGPKVNIAPGPENANVSVANCPPGSKAISGGYFFGYANGGITVEASRVLADGTGWMAGFGNNGSSSGEATAYVVCAAQ